MRLRALAFDKKKKKKLICALNCHSAKEAREEQRALKAALVGAAKDVEAARVALRRVERTAGALKRKRR